MKKLLHIMVKVLSTLVAMALLFAYLAKYISPASTWIFAFFGLLFLPLVIINLFLLLCWAMMKRKTAWIHAVLLLPTLFFLPEYVQLRQPKAAAKAPYLKVMTYNVHLFGINHRTKKLETLPTIARFIQDEAPDIVCLQEVGMFDTLAVKRSFPNYPHTHFHARRQRNNTWYATATLSRHPIKNRGVIAFASVGNVCIYTDIWFDNRPLRVYNNHLESTRLDLTRSFSRFRRETQRNDEIKDVSLRLRDAFVKRAAQVDLVVEHITQAPSPVLVCGDFNDFPMSYTYRKMKGHLTDAFMAAGHGIPSTYRNFLPAFRIDYIFSDDHFLTPSHYYIPLVEHSDHYPVVAIYEHL